MSTAAGAAAAPAGRGAVNTHLNMEGKGPYIGRGGRGQDMREVTVAVSQSRTQPAAYLNAAAPFFHNSPDLLQPLTRPAPSPPPLGPFPVFRPFPQPPHPLPLPLLPLPRVPSSAQTAVSLPSKMFCLASSHPPFASAPLTCPASSLLNSLPSYLAPPPTSPLPPLPRSPSPGQPAGCTIPCLHCSWCSTG